VIENLAKERIDTWNCQLWSQMCRFHPDFFYGHLTPIVPEIRVVIVDTMLRRLSHLGSCIALTDPFAGCGSTEQHRKLRKYTISNELFFVSATQPNGKTSLHLPIPNTTEGPRAGDLVSAALAASWLESTVFIHYLDRGDVVEVMPSALCWALAWRMAAMTNRNAEIERTRDSNITNANDNNQHV
jgi:hypothetical protein